MDKKGIACEMESVIDEKTANNKTMFRVRWRGFSPEDDTWEFEENIKNKNLLIKYKENMKAKINKEKKTQNMSALAKLRQKKPVQVVSVMNFNNKIYYRVLFEDKTFDSVPSTLLKKASPELIANYLISHFQLLQAESKKKNGTNTI
ncbi:hypothetical protein M9Y10_012066 [Tritrichomonas musculus]|uniref:Chromo domain-containing protein n=1 Tax=Tritrichomonas musculus TaxID=1915356 RepID=A0ABR2IBQ0_9EUKA